MVLVQHGSSVSLQICWVPQDRQGQPGITQQDICESGLVWLRLCGKCWPSVAAEGFITVIISAGHPDPLSRHAGSPVFPIS